MNILGISAFYHDSAAALIQEGKIIAAAQEERFTRKKHDEGFPSQAIRYILKESGLRIDDLDAVVFYDKPFLKFERILETYYDVAPKGILSFLRTMPIWIKQKLFIKDLIFKELAKIEVFDKKKIKLLFPSHHLSHAASAFYPSSFEEAAILTIDGVGEWATASICHGKGASIKVLKELHFPHSLGLLYSAVTYYCGFRVNSGEYKLMGLAPYGNLTSPQVAFFKEKIKENILKVYDDGSIWLNPTYFSYTTELKMVHEKRWETLLGLPLRKAETDIEEAYCNLALAIQQITEEVVLKMAKEAQRLTQSKNICLAGGVALNCVSNGKLLKSGLFQGIFIQPAAGDAGGALGAALAAQHIYFEKERKIDSTNSDAMQGAYLGIEYTNKEIAQILQRNKAIATYIEDFEALAMTTAKLLAQGNVVGWVQGRMEFGPRALGNRSILADARNPEMQRKVNLKIKFREGFRPFAPSILAEEKANYFENSTPSPYMLLVENVNPTQCFPLPDNYHALSMSEKLYFERSTLPAITHIDYSARVQSVHQATNPRYWQLLKAFQQETGCPLLINTSFNVRGEPIVCSPEDAFRCFMACDMDYLVVGNFLLDKKMQTLDKQHFTLSNFHLD